MTGWLIGEVRELIGRAFRTGACRRAAGSATRAGFLHRSREPSAQAPIDQVTAAASTAADSNRDARTAAEEPENEVVNRGFPWACRSEGQPVQDDFRLAS